MIPIGNVYYMLSYCFETMHREGMRELASEDFEGAADLCAAILACGLRRQVRRGLGRRYVTSKEDLAVLRGRVDFSRSMGSAAALKGRLECEFDDLTEDMQMNRIIKSTALTLMVRPDVKQTRKKELRLLMPYLKNVGTVDINRIEWRFEYGQNDEDYRLLMFVCKLAANNLLQREIEGGKRLCSFFDDQSMAKLYEKFVLAYYRREHPELDARACQIKWALDDSSDGLLPVMQTDVSLRRGDQTLIIDTKFYANELQKHLGALTQHSHNLYQIFCYVKNAQAALPKDSPPVSGMLLYAKTDEPTPADRRYHMSGNAIEVRSLDLSGDFASIRAQLNEIAEGFF
jgi:5-methylcytosine-specific restriction enzyme subunit McrC